MKHLGYLILITILFSCSHIPKDVQRSLELAGDNREELQKVIDHYQNPEDSLKLQAAYFLISEKVPYGVYIDSRNERVLEDFFNTLNDSLNPFFEKENKDNANERRRMITKLIDHYKFDHGKIFNNRWPVKRDIESIKASFLIENIDYAFKSWELPWSKHYSFQEFCQYILPYRTGKQYPNAWRKYFNEAFKSFRDSIGEERDPSVVAKQLNEYLNQKIFMSCGLYDAPYTLTGPHMYQYKIYGNCVSLSNMIQEAMRSIGIATTEVLMNKFGYNGKDHIANAILDSKGNWQYFNALSQAPGTLVFEEKLTKVYRKSLIHTEGLKKNKIEVLSKLKLFGWEDITRQVTESFDISVKLTDINHEKYKTAYLCIFDNQIRGGWVPIDWSLIDSNEKEVVFKDIGGKEVVYLAMTDDDRVGLRPLSNPFILKKDGSVTYLNSDQEEITMEINRKHPPKKHLIKIAMSLNGGRFEASNSPDFKIPNILYTLKDITNVSNVIVDIPPKAYRYYRFVYPKIEDKKYYDIAKLAFGNYKEGHFVESKGRYLASKGINTKVLDALFDSDLLTYSSIYRREEGVKSYTGGEAVLGLSENVWIGLDLGSPQQISKLYYCPRTDKNGIYAGMEYELFYWNNEWVSGGSMQGSESGILNFENVPKGTLYWLKNHTEGKEERIFTYEDGKQVWW
ncbi:hypothetical protein [Snuella lapsa]|uniref:Transglutaminase domain-containing protein n=1 Tax=Snuella lapsa TaxID=870481 RepID=A0ABP6X3J0_9FLAO